LNNPIRAIASAVGNRLAQFGGGGPMIRGNGQAYTGGKLTRIWKDWMPWHRSGDAAIQENWSLLTARVRDLTRNDGVMRSAKRAMAKHVVGPGIKTHADVWDADVPDDDYNFEADDLFDHWCEHEADVRGQSDFGQLQWQVFSEVMETGEVFLLKVQDASKGRSVPYCLQMIETEQIDLRQDRPQGLRGENKIVRGVEYDSFDRPVAYYIYDQHPYDIYSGWTGASKRIPAARVIHLHLPGRPSERRGISWFAANMQTAKDLDWYLGNELTAAALGALLTLIIKRKNGAGSGVGFAGDNSSTDGNSDDNGNSLVKLGRGIVADIGAEDDIKVAESSRPNRDAAPFVKLMLMLQGMGVGLSQLRLTGDYSQSSYTSARGAHLDDQAYFVVLQHWFGHKFVLPVRREWTRQAVAYGRLRSIGARQFAKDEWKYLRCTPQAPGREQLDPEKETGAAMRRIRAGFSTWQHECGLRGHNWRRIVIQQERERKFFVLHGFTPDLADTAALKPLAASDVAPASGQPGGVGGDGEPTGGAD
jgi:lambda family phage portal protein